MLNTSASFFNISPTRTVSFSPVRMYGGLADSKMPGGGPDGGFVFYDVFRKLHGAPFDVGFQMHHSKPIYC